MLGHGYYPTELLKSNIISIPKDRTASLSIAITTEEFLYLTVDL